MKKAQNSEASPEIPTKGIKRGSSKNTWFKATAAYRTEHGSLVPSAVSPVCIKCGLATEGCVSPYMEYRGSEDPLITLIVEGVSRTEDKEGVIGQSGGWTEYILKKFEACRIPDFDVSRIRVVPATRCAATSKINLATRAKWCRAHIVEDLQKFRPKLIVPVGSMPLGLLSHKSNAQDWAGKLLTYRGWPDDWITDPVFSNGHPVFGDRPTREAFLPIFPILSPGLVQAAQNRDLLGTWMQQIRDATKMALGSPKVMDYLRPWYRLTSNIETIKRELAWLAEHPGTLLTFDTETTGLKQFAHNQRIVMMMFRWTRNNRPVSLGFPWDFDTSELLNAVPELTPYVLRALYASRLQGHNLPFDILFVYATLAGADLHLLTSAMYADTMHMLYTLKQRTGSLGLELMAYNFVKDLAGYEEEMTLLIDRHESMDPKRGGHYANCPA